MTVKEYLKNAYRLDNKINSNLEELAKLKELVTSISAVKYDEKVQTSKSNTSPFINTINKIIKLEKKIDEEIDSLVDLKNEMREAVENVEDTDEQLVLRYRYFNNMTWDDIAMTLNIGKSTARRIHDNAIKHIVIKDCIDERILR